MKVLYEKVTVGKRVRYIEHVSAEDIPFQAEFTNEELVSLAVYLGTTMLMQLEQQLPPTKTNARNIRRVTDAILLLATGFGGPIKGEMINYWWRIWIDTIKRAESELTEKVKSKEVAPWTTI
jgi:hypothetical protein